VVNFQYGGHPYSVAAHELIIALFGGTLAPNGFAFGSAFFSSLAEKATQSSRKHFEREDNIWHIHLFVLRYLVFIEGYLRYAYSCNIENVSTTKRRSVATGWQGHSRIS
jgi:hypothetical protein